MQMRTPGYLRPHQSGALRAEQEQQIAAVCPGLGQEVDAAGRQDDDMWGPYVSMHTGHATDPDLRFTGSSGGGISALLVYLLDQGLVDGVVQTGADPVVPVANMAVLSRTAGDVKDAAGSRYAPSSPLAGLAAQLDSGRRFAFVGKPCDVAALRALTLQDEKIRRTFPYLLSFFCAGVPSQTGAKAVLRALGTDLERTQDFRYRGNGWPGQATATDKDGSTHSMSYHDSWGNILSKHVQHRCKICADGTGVAADVVCADAWEVDDRGYPLFEERDGTSLIVGRTMHGEELIAAATKAGAIATAPFDVAELAKMQPGQTGRRQALWARLAGLKLMGKPIPHYQGLHIRTVARRNPVTINLKNFLGMVRRVLQGRIGP